MIKDELFFSLEGRGDNGYYDSIREVVGCDSYAEEGGVYNVSVFKKSYQPKLSHFMPDLENDLINQADGSDFSEFSDTVLEQATKEQIAELETLVANVIDEWADKYGHQPTFYNLEEVEVIKIRILSDGEYEILK